MSVRSASGGEHGGKVEAAVEPAAEISKEVRQRLQERVVVRAAPGIFDVAEYSVQLAQALQMHSSRASYSDDRLLLLALGWMSAVGRDLSLPLEA